MDDYFDEGKQLL